MPTAVSKACAAMCVVGEDAVYARESDGSEGHITEDGECDYRGIDATSMSKEDAEGIDGVEGECHSCHSEERESKNSTK